MLNGCIETNIIMITNQWCEFNAAIFPTFTELQPNFYLAVLDISRLQENHQINNGIDQVSIIRKSDGDTVLFIALLINKTPNYSSERRGLSNEHKHDKSLNNEKCILWGTI